MVKNGTWKKWASPVIARSRLKKYELARLWLDQGLKNMG
jgi:hypothetical protein